MTPEQMVSRLLYRDGLMLVIDKPAGFAVHRGPKGGESLEDHFDALRFGLPRSPALAHRLDRDTSGCLVLGRHRKALALLGRLFKSGAVEKTYWAVVEGAPATDEGTIEFSLGRLDETRGWWMKHDPNGQPAVTKWKVLGSLPFRCWGRENKLARARTSHRADTSIARALRRDGLADCRRRDLRRRAAQRRACSPSACSRGRGAALQEPLGHPRGCAGAAAHAYSARAVWVERGRVRTSRAVIPGPERKRGSPESITTSSEHPAQIVNMDSGQPLWRE